MTEWKTYRLGDIVQFNPTERISKGSLAKKVSMDKLIPYCREVSGCEVEPFTGGMKFRNGDTIMARITPCLENGKTSLVSFLDDNEVGFGSTEYIVFRAIEEITDCKFVYYFVTSPAFRNVAIKSMVGSSGRQRVQQSVLEDLEVALPSLEEQRRIAGILGAIDDKIENNRRINTNLELQAQALYKQWFVDNRSDDWKTLILDDVATLSAGGDKPPVCSDKKTPDCNIPIYSNGIDNEGLYGYTNRPRITENSITISARGTIGFVCLRTEPYVPIVRLISIVPTHEHISAYFLYLWALTQNISGTGTTQQQLTVPAFRTTKIVVPSQEILIKFNKVVKPIFDSIKQYQKENETLVTLRDTLLPKLMNGEIITK